MRVAGEGSSNGAVGDAVADALSEALGLSQQVDNAPRDYGLVRCEFERNEPPFGLTAFECAERQCSISASRLEELRVLLHREVAEDGVTLAAFPLSQQGSETPLSEKVRQCWNVGALSTDAKQVIVNLAMDIDRDGTPTNLRLLSHTGATATIAEQAYSAARRAVLRCGPYSVENVSDGDRSVELAFGSSGITQR